MKKGKKGKKDQKSLAGFLKQEWLFLLMLALAVLLAFPNLGDRVIDFNDEVSSLIIAKGIVETGLPVYKESNYATANVFGREWWVLNTPLNEYLIAGSFMLFGESDFTARLPGVLFGLAFLVMFLVFMREIGLKRQTRNIAMLLVVLNPVFYLFIRHARYYGLVLFLVASSLYCFARLVKSSRKTFGWGFIASMTLLFYSMIQTFGELSFVMLCFVLIFRRDSFIRVLKNFVLIGIFALPWFIPWFFIWKKVEENSFALARIPVNAAIIMYYYLLFFIPLLMLVLLPRVIKKIKTGRHRLMWLPLCMLVLLLIFKSVMNHNIAPEFRKIFMIILPASSIIIAYLVAAVKKNAVQAAVIILLVTSNIIFVVPFLPLRLASEESIENVSAGRFNPATAVNFADSSTRIRSYLYDYLYEITHHFASPSEDVAAFLKKHASRDSLVFISWEDYPAHYYSGRITTRNISMIESGKADWVIFADNKDDNDHAYWIDMEKIDKHRFYKEYASLDNKIRPWIGTPEPLHHRFRTDRSGKILIYNRRT